MNKILAGLIVYASFTVAAGILGGVFAGIVGVVGGISLAGIFGLAGFLIYVIEVGD